VVHVSDLTNQNKKFCPREVVLARKFELPPATITVDPAMRITWDEGRDKQARVNNDYLREHMVGEWKCTNCGTKAVWGRVPKGLTGSCIRSFHAWRYVEPTFLHPSGFVGSLDGLVDFGLPKFRILEVKIIKADEFKQLKAPLAEHRIRTRLYLKLVAETGSLNAQTIDPNVAHVLYMMRGYGAKADTGRITPLKEFTVSRKDDEIQQYVAWAQTVKTSTIQDVVPYGICPSAFTSRAAQCPVVKQCFSGQYPAEEVLL
jgi:hypothetical protein